MNFNFSNKFIASGQDKNEVLVIPRTEICHVGMNGNYFVFTKEELEKSFKSLNKVPIVANVSDGDGDHDVTTVLNTVGWVYEPVFENDTVYATLEITHPEIINKVKRKTTKGEREVNFVSMGCNVKVAKCSICESEIFMDTYACDSGHHVGEKYDGKVCSIIGEGIVFEHVALTNLPADKNAKLGKEVVVMYAEKKEIENKETKETTTEPLTEVKSQDVVKQEQDNLKNNTPAEEVMKPSEEKKIEALVDKINVLETEIEKMKDIINKTSDEEENKEAENMVEEEKKVETAQTEPVKDETKTTATEKTEEEIKKEEEMKAQEVVDEENKVESKKGNVSAAAISMYKKLIARKFGSVPEVIASSDSLNFVKSYYNIKMKANTTGMNGNKILANSNKDMLEVHLKDHTPNGWKNYIAEAKRQGKIIN